MSDSLDALGQRIEAARIAHERIRIATAAVDSAIAELRASLHVVRNRVEQIAKTVSPDDYEHHGEAASHQYRLGDQAGEKTVFNQLVDVLLTTFAPLADRIIGTVGNDQFPTDRLPPTPDELAGKLEWHLVPHFRPERLDMDLFGLESPDLTLAGKLMLVWAKWASVPGRDRPPAYRDRQYLPWVANLVNRYREDPHTWRVLVHPFDWSIRAFDEVAAVTTPQRAPLLTPEVKAALEPLRALNEQERERDRKQAELFLLAQGWQPAAISAYLTFPANAQKVRDAEQVKRSMPSPLPHAMEPPAPKQPPAAGASEQGEGAGKSRAEILQALPLCVRQAYLAYQLAETMHGKRSEDREAYDYIKEYGLPDNAGDLGELSDYDLPVFDTWARYLREARPALGEQKYNRRANRQRGRSITTGDEIERPRRDE